MSKEKSFTATLSSNYGHLHFPRLTHGREVTIPITGFFDFSPTHVFVSDTLFAKRDLPKATLKFYFRNIGTDFYQMYVVTPGPLFGREIGLNENGNLTAMAGPEAGPKEFATFNISDKGFSVNGRPITRSKNSSEGFITQTTTGIAMSFQLTNIERNVDWNVIGR